MMSNADDPATSQSHPVSIYYNRNGFIRPGRSHHLNKPNMQHHIQNAIIQQHLGNAPVGSNPNGLAYSMQNLNLLDAGNNMMFLNSDGIPIMQKSESDSASSGESIDDTPPDTPMATNISSNSGNNKNFKLREHSMMKRHRHHIGSTAPVIFNQLPPPISVVAESQRMPMVQSDTILSPTISPQQQPQQTHNTMDLNMTGTNTSNNNLVTGTVLISNKPGSATPGTIPGFSIGGNPPPVLFQQYPPPPPPHHIQQGIPQSQLNTTYHYHHIPINNRASILTTTNTTSPGPLTTSYRLPYHIQPNGELLYPFPSTIAYIQQTAIPLSRPSNHPQTHPIIPQQLQSTHSTVSTQVKTNPMLSRYQTVPEIKANVSCFNCGSPFHTGRDCQEASMEDVTRGTIYKLDYNSTALNDTKQDVDNSGNGSSAISNIEVSNTEPTSLPTIVTNK